MEIVLRTFPGRLANLAQTARQVSAVPDYAVKILHSMALLIGRDAFKTATVKTVVVQQSLAPTTLSFSVPRSDQYAQEILLPYRF